MVTYPNRFVPMITTRYPIYVKNDEIFGIPIANGSLYNRICTGSIETLEGNHYGGLKAIPISFGARKFIVMNLNVKILVNLISIMYFHNVITTKIVPLDPKGNPPDTMKKTSPL
jgi:hypothetical protein